MLVRIKVVDDNSNSVIFEPSIIKLPHYDIKINVFPFELTYLVEVCGDLYFVCILMKGLYDTMRNYDILKAVVWRLDLSQMEWIQIESLGDRAFLLSDCGSTWCWAGTSVSNVTGDLIESDCIYLANRLGSQTMHTYHLRDDSYTAWLLHPNFRWTFDCLTWFVPREHVRLSSIQKEKIDTGEKLRQAEEIKEGMGTNLRTACETLCFTIPPAKGRVNCSFPLFLSLKKCFYELLDLCEAISYTIETPHSPSYLSKLEFCKDGWLLVRFEGDVLKYINPLTKEQGEYPRDHSTVPDLNYAFSTCPNPPDCLTVGIGGYDDVRISCFQAAIGKWDYYFCRDTGFQVNYHSSPRYLNEAFYYIDMEGNLGVFKTTEDERSWKVYPSPLTEEERKLLNSCYLVELDGELILVLFQHGGSRVQVFKFDIVIETWFQLDTLGEHVLFLSPASSFSLSEKDTTKRNRIYLPKRIGNEIVYYSLDKGKYYTLNGKYSSDDFYGMRTQPFSCWI